MEKLFTTEDGVEIFEGTPYVCIFLPIYSNYYESEDGDGDLLVHHNNIYENIGKLLPPNCRYRSDTLSFSTKEVARKYIIENGGYKLKGE